MCQRRSGTIDAGCDQSRRWQMRTARCATTTPVAGWQAGGAYDWRRAHAFWDTHSLADYWDQVHEVKIEVRVRRRRRVTLDSDVWEKVVSRARSRGLADVIRQHRSEHGRELLTAACQEAIRLGAVEPVLQRFTAAPVIACGGTALLTRGRRLGGGFVYNLYEKILRFSSYRRRPCARWRPATTRRLKSLRPSG